MLKDYCIIFSLILFCGCKKSFTDSINLPSVENRIIVENHHGISYENNFSNLENFKNARIKQWYSLQDSITENYFNQNRNFDSIYGYYENLEYREGSLERDIKYNESGSVYYLSQESPSKGNNINFLYTKPSPSSSPLSLFDPSNYKDGSYEIDYYQPSYDGNFVAIAMGRSEDFFKEIVILNTRTKEIINSPLTNTKPNKAGGIVWSPNSKCILFIYYPDMDKKNSDRGSSTTQFCLEVNKEPKEIFANKLDGRVLNEENYPVPKIRSSNSNYVFIYEGNASDFWDCYYISVDEFQRGDYNWKLLYSSNDKVFHSWGKERNHIYYFKRSNGDDIEFCSIDLRRPNFKTPAILAKGDGDIQLSGFEITSNGIYYSMTTNGIDAHLYKYNEGNPQKIELPVQAGEIDFKSRSPYKEDIWITINSWTSNPKDYYINSKGTFEFVELGMWPNYPEFKNIISEVIEVSSHDGTKIPLSIVRRKDHNFNAQSMGIITAYGAYGMSEAPWFHSPIADFVNKGNIYATAHVRGGGEKGPAWHEEGMKSKKENSWKDLIACSEFLVKNKFIHKSKLALNVNSAGGIAGGMAVNLRPDLYRVFTGFLPSLNVLRTEYLENFDDSDSYYEFGTIKEKESFMDLLKMDPVNNLLKNIDYPSTLLTIGFDDNLVPPSDSGKYIAFVQAYTSNKNKPYLLDVKFNTEHEIDYLNDYARMLFFTVNELSKRN